MFSLDSSTVKTRYNWVTLEDELSQGIINDEQ